MFRCDYHVSCYRQTRLDYENSREIKFEGLVGDDLASSSSILLIQVYYQSHSRNQLSNNYTNIVPLLGNVINSCAIEDSLISLRAY